MAGGHDPMTARPEQGVAGERRHDVRAADRDPESGASPLRGVAVEGARRASRSVGAYGAFAIALAVAVLVLALASTAVIAIYDAITTEDGVAGLDQPVLDDLMDTRTPLMNAVLTAITHTAGKIGMPLIAVVAMVVLGVRRRSWTPVLLIAVTGAVSVLITVVGKEFIHRVRPPYSDAVPPLELSDSFPSGHTLNAVAVIGIITYLIALRRTTRRARVLLVAGASVYVALIGFTRVYLGHHWFTDVLAGLVLGLAWLALVITAHRFYLTVRVLERRPSRVGDGDPPEGDVGTLG